MKKETADCLFCNIIEGVIPSKKAYEDDQVVCIHDIQPQAKIHLLVLPKQHVASLDHAFPKSGKQHVELVGMLLEKATFIARQHGLLPNGFRVVINTNRDAGQTVDHLHVHVLGGEPLSGGFGS